MKLGGTAEAMTFVPVRGQGSFFMSKETCLKTSKDLGIEKAAVLPIKAFGGKENDQGKQNVKNR